MKRRYLWLIAPVVLSLGLTGTALAGTSHAQPQKSHGVGGTLGVHFGWSFGKEAAPLGSVEGLSGTTLTVLEFDGATQAYTVGGSTLYFLDGKMTTSNAVVAGLNVIVSAGRDWGAGKSSSTKTVVAVFLISPNVLGNIQSVTVGATGDTISVLNPQGFAFTIQTSSTTTFYVDGVSSATAPTFTDGQIIAALGLVDSVNKDQVDATQVNVVKPHSKW